jgi:hypothetical protein
MPWRFLFSAVPLLACAGRRDRPPVPACAKPNVQVGGWQQIDAGAFTFRLPPGYLPQKVGGVESQVARWVAGERRTISYDLGPYSSDLGEAKRHLTEFSECRDLIGARQAKLVSGWDAAGQWGGNGPKYVVAATWRDIRPHVHLTISATTDDPNEQETLLAVLRSVEFKS